MNRRRPHCSIGSGARSIKEAEGVAPWLHASRAELIASTRRSTESGTGGNTNVASGAVLPQSNVVRQPLRCFRNPVLLSSHGGHQVFPFRRIGVNDEHTDGSDQAQKIRGGHEDLAERQPLWGQACLHRRSSDFGPKL